MSILQNIAFWGQIPVCWIGLQNSFKLDCSWRKLNKKLYSRFAPHFLQALMGTIQSVQMTDPMSDVKQCMCETFNLRTKLNLVQS